MKTQEKTIVLHTYPDMLEAKMIQDILQESNIDSFLNDENLMGMDPVGGTEVRIFEKDIEAAEKIISARHISADEKVKQA